MRTANTTNFAQSPTARYAMLSVAAIGVMPLREGAEKLMAYAKEYGISPHFVQGVTFRPGKMDLPIHTIDLSMVGTAEGVTAQVVIFWGDGRQSRGKAYPVAWAVA